MRTDLARWGGDAFVGVCYGRCRSISKQAKFACLTIGKMNTANCDTLPIRMRNGAFCVPVRIAEKLRAVEKAIAEFPKSLRVL